MTSTGKAQSEKKWLKISLFCPLLPLEALADLLAVLSDSGVEQSPETEEGATLSAFFPLDDGQQEQQTTEILQHVQREVDALFALYGLLPVKLETQLLADEDWATSWQQYFKAFAIAPGLIIHPSWEEYQPKEGERTLLMDPGMAFGTGQHATTRMTLALIQRCLAAKAVDRVLDVGTGTGILAMAAVLFGAKSALALDNDPEALLVAQDNIRINNLDQSIELSDTAPQDLRQGQFALICANIVHDTLTLMAPHLTRLLTPRGHLILSGILSGTQERNIRALYQDLGLEAIDCLYQEEWCALLFSPCQK